MTPQFEKKEKKGFFFNMMKNNISLHQRALIFIVQIVKVGFK
jgi:hypothetical protein